MDGGGGKENLRVDVYFLDQRRECSVSLLFVKHILIHPMLEDDYTRLFIHHI